MNDISLRQTVLDELEFYPAVDAAKIGVAVEKGVVTLSGHVNSYAEKIAAERIVQRVRNVRGVAQEIEVRYPNARKDADDEIAGHVHGGQTSALYALASSGAINPEVFDELNRDYASSWPNITRRADPPADADEWKGVEGKFEKFFSPNPGKR